MKSLRKTKIQSAYQLTPDDMPYLFNRTSENGIMTIKKAVGSFSSINGSDVRIVYTESGTILGTVKKLKDRKGYQVVRVDGKVRVKETLQAAYKSIRRAS